jgi:hypothetical protein
MPSQRWPPLRSRYPSRPAIGEGKRDGWHGPAQAVRPSGTAIANAATAMIETPRTAAPLRQRAKTTQTLDTKQKPWARRMRGLICRELSSHLCRMSPLHQPRFSGMASVTLTFRVRSVTFLPIEPPTPSSPDLRGARRRSHRRQMSAAPTRLGRVSLPPYRSSTKSLVLSTSTPSSIRPRSRIRSRPAIASRKHKDLKSVSLQVRGKPKAILEHSNYCRKPCLAR